MRSFVILILAAPAFAQNGINLYSLEREAALGHDVAARLEAGATVVRNPEIDRYLTAAIDNLRPTFDRDLPFRFVVFDDSQPVTAAYEATLVPEGGLRQASEVVTVPGGILFIPLRLLRDSSDESAFRLMLAHGMAHAVLRHGTRLQTLAPLAAYAAIPALLTPISAGPLQVEVSGRLVLLGLTSRRKSFEREAATLAAKVASEAGGMDWEGFAAAQAAAR